MMTHAHEAARKILDLWPGVDIELHIQEAIDAACAELKPHATAGKALIDTIGAMCESGVNSDDTRDECMDKYIATWEKLTGRIRDLTRYVRHHSDCPASEAAWQRMESGECNCGLAAVIQSIPSTK